MDKKAARTTSKFNTMSIILAIVALFGIGLSAYFYTQLQKEKTTTVTNTRDVTNAKAKAVKEKIAKLISVPEDEMPVLAAVDNPDKLKDQPFFKGAKKGDQLVMFPKAKKAILYRESESKLINVGPIAITSDTKTDKKE